MNDKQKQGRTEMEPLYIHETVNLTVWKQGKMYHANYHGHHLKATGLSGIFRQMSVYDNLWNHNDNGERINGFN